MSAPTLRALVEGATRVLDEAGVASPRVDATALAAHALGLDRLDLVLAPPVPEGFAATYADLVDRRRRREPLQHIVGRTTFRWLTLHVEPGVFVPRPETEVVAQVAVDEAARLVAAGTSPVVVDLCCGAGGLGLAVATEVPGSRVAAVDASPAAVALTRRNAADAGADVRVLPGDVRDTGLLADLAGRVDVVVSNPPYIPPDAEPVDPEVRDHDPDLALYGGGADGLDVPRAVLAAAVRLLRPGGLLVMEHAEVQDGAARDAAHATGGLVDVETRPDLTGRPRMLVARRSVPELVRSTRPDVGDSTP
ncbi:peptide chain release factor N(5)-glutamine methyltransferase [Cellulomonas fimi]|uniref:Release factor glutamine methyltransferase n=1 Tax=Cellulomonas fimi (strain ATCC 484 / DSM 20113 / JCM 1341 / CCUG 24087 / LMG 16345 / NBRC 15513 / NCIMB 8980 / NCTC 7547 / NRS-133) TaxID=590998 RepID=F4H7X2_CELFA|nr:peptide chain release factor N(5)-glutamine methyltransferase [Cellulomonas fimi]AEE46933.1 protein-(glutamine-N5) methyltransferase, release factor-specific [Cellulomonas fimi ATCC 484]NNH07880.1 peptide chain release factor N(5)-glutamine methyltransferase [Cellulomonas fimi]VEH34605.1 Release factor glutamine methyltransferase [Cellulomonas fimi]